MVIADYNEDGEWIQIKPITSISTKPLCQECGHETGNAVHDLGLCIDCLTASDPYRDY